ncbi:serine aminopeptidase domain-containing protein [Aliikangiella maris]|uniref:Alpha/beta hydrolase n=2 Tax=Aliikangiella maris TaxID=3162458 RepID=A0ABV3MR98_9GAMM
MHSFHFGNSQEPLYGVHHEPVGTAFRQSAVIICNPIGHEYYRAHTALCTLADRLANNGYHVLRFDYRGTGDSFGELADYSVADWCDDIMLAADELKAMSGVNNIVAIGLRAGALLTLLTAKNYSFDQLILWDCITQQSSVGQNLQAMHRQFLQSQYWFKYPQDSQVSEVNEYLGFHYSADYLKFLNGADEQLVELPDYLPVTSIYSTKTPENIDSENMFNKMFNEYQCHYIDEAIHWNDVMKHDIKLTTADTLTFIEEALS